MVENSLNFYRTVSQELDPGRLQKKFLTALLDLQNVERGSIWVKSDIGYTCIEAAGAQSEIIKGMTVEHGRPSVVGWVIENGRMTIAEGGKDPRHYSDAEKNFEVKSKLLLCFPLLLKTGEVYGAIEVIDTSSGGDRLNLSQSYLQLLQTLIDIGSIALSNSLIYSDQVKENAKLRKMLETIRGEDVIVGRSPVYMAVRKRASEYARTDFPVLITGESGAGKELLAREIHRLSARKNGQFLAQNCSCIPETLLESELFGYQKGAFTGAFRSRAGLFETANGGTVFLDEIGDMPLSLQARILRVIQEGEIKPLGDDKPKKVDVRIVSATNRELREEIARGNFREDLFYRLNVLPLRVPPLRERPEDIPLLLEHFAARESLRMGFDRKTFSREALDFMLSYDWPGNVRELENTVKHAIVISSGKQITKDDIGTYIESSRRPEPAKPVAESSSPKQESVKTLAGGIFDGYTWERLERDYIIHLLEKNKWHVTRAAKEAGVNRSTFDSRMKKLDIRR